MQIVQTKSTRRKTTGDGSPDLSQLRTNGYVYLRDISRENLRSLLESLGNIIQVTDVKINTNSKALVTSSKELDFHTDHHKVDIIAWHCIKQFSEGGYSVFLDIEDVLEKFTEQEKEQLASIHLYEHKIFDDDKDSHPLLNKVKGKYRCYYSFWLVKENLEKADQELLARFRSTIANIKTQKILLQPKDVLLIDNGRILHGRTEIKGNKDRFLKRFWISNPNFFT